MWDNKDQVRETESGKLISPSERVGGNIGMDAVKGVRKIARKGLDQIPIVGSIVDPIMNLLKRSDEQKLREWAFQDQFVRRYLTPSQYKQYKAQDRRKLGSGIPFPFVDFGKAWSVLSDPTLFKGPEVSAKEGRAIVAEYKRTVCRLQEKWRHPQLRLMDKMERTWGLIGGAIDIHKEIGKLPKPKRGFTLPGHNYTGPYNPLEEQIRYDPKTGEILEIYQQPTGMTDAIAMQHDVDYSICKDDKKCKNDADRKMVKALDAIPWKDRQWGHWLARNAINTKQKLGLGVSKNGKSRH